MSLLKKTEATENAEASPFVEEVQETKQPTPAERAAAAAEAHAKAQASAPKAEVAVKTAKVNVRVLDELKDAMRVDFDTLAGVKANQGQFQNAEDNKKSMGDEIVMQLLSYQDNWVCSPNDLNADKDLVKYSDDGVTAKDGTDMRAHLQLLKEQGYDKAKIGERLVLVGALLASAKPTPLKDQLFQIDLSPKSRSEFLRYKANVAWNLKIGKVKEEDVLTIKLAAVTADGPNNSTYTKVLFSTYEAPAA